MEAVTWGGLGVEVGRKRGGILSGEGVSLGLARVRLD